MLLQFVDCALALGMIEYCITMSAIPTINTTFNTVLLLPRGFFVCEFATLVLPREASKTNATQERTRAAFPIRDCCDAVLIFLLVDVVGVTDVLGVVVSCCRSHNGTIKILLLLIFFFGLTNLETNIHRVNR